MALWTISVLGKFIEKGIGQNGSYMRPKLSSEILCCVSSGEESEERFFVIGEGKSFLLE